MTSQDNLQTIDLDLLRDVSGGQFPLPLQVPTAPLAAPPQPKPATPAPGTTFTPPTTMAPPKYSAGWWDIVRRMGIAR